MGCLIPEKFFISVLNQLEIDYITQLNSSHYDWVGKYRYDFYIPSINCIVETHGGQHYKDVLMYGVSRNQLEIDIEKKNLAIENGIDSYIEIDCRYSNMEWIRNSILDSVFSQFFDLSNIDWEECGKFASKSLFIEVCNFYNKTNMLIPQLSKEFKLSDVTILRYLNTGNEIGLCNFDVDDNKSRVHKEAWKNSTELKKQKRPVYCHELNIIVESVNEAQRKYKAYRLNEICGNPQRTSGGYHWSYVDQLSEDILTKISLTN